MNDTDSMNSFLSITFQKKGKKSTISKLVILIVPQGSKVVPGGYDLYVRWYLFPYSIVIVAFVIIKIPSKNISQLKGRTDFKKQKEGQTHIILHV